jgi:hypothetical protein
MNRALDRMLLAAVLATPITAATVGHFVADSYGFIFAILATGILCLFWWGARRGLLP